ncbi:MAG TPA: PfkB family carbohydrate kinase [Candidatus Dormibacteraeota bacterium]|nr:PfkB family carbohydrate kinase [Candidatus Dormibacteraeota bacterium]
MGFDDLTTPAGRRREIPGGSALYFSLAAGRLCDVRVSAAIGADGAPLLKILDEAHIDRSAVDLLPGATYRWRAEHHLRDALPVAEEQRLGVYLDWRPDLPSAARSSEILFLGSMHPARQLEILDQCPSVQLVALDTMRDFITSNRAELDQLLLRTTMLFANEAELRALLPSPGSAVLSLAREAVVLWNLRTIILKLGAHGAVAISPDGIREYPAATGPKVVDPTGAGDALAGGLLGRLAQIGRMDDSAVDLAMTDGAAAARAAISAFGVQRLLGPAPGSA